MSGISNKISTIQDFDKNVVSHLRGTKHNIASLIGYLNQIEKNERGLNRNMMTQKHKSKFLNQKLKRVMKAGQVSGDQLAS